MSKNLIPQIAEMLGIELGEEFKVGNNSVRFWFDLDGLHSEECVTADYTLYHLVCGNCQIIKLPWKPKYDDVFYTFLLDFKDDGDGYVWKVAECFWDDSPVDFAFLKAGWAFRTRAEAEATLPNVAKELGVEYEL